MRTILLAAAAVVALSLPAAAQTQTEHDAHHPEATATPQQMQPGAPMQQGQMQPGQMQPGQMGMSGQGGMMSGMMGQGGMMGGMMGKGAGMGQGGMMMGGALGPCAMMTGKTLDLTAAEAKTLVDAMLIRHGNDRLRAGTVEQQGDKLVAVIETVDGSLVSRVAVDPKTGMMQPTD